MTFKEISQIFYVTETRLGQCYSDILQGKINFVVIFIVSGMEDFQAWKLTHDSKHLDVQTYHSISTNDDCRVHLMHVCTTFTVSRASAGRPRCRWRSGSDVGGGLCQSRLSRAPVEEFKASAFNIDSKPSSIHMMHCWGSAQKCQERKEIVLVQNSDRLKSYSMMWCFVLICTFWCNNFQKFIGRFIETERASSWKTFN